MNALDRRRFLKLMGVAGLTATMPWPLKLARAQLTDEPYTGPLFVTIAASGGWDPTSFCDPKENVPGEREINHWSRTLQTLTFPRSSIIAAPFANNQAFFGRFHRHMLVINGVDSQTNSHDTGVRFNWSGREDPGYPAFAAIAAAVYGQNLPLPYLTNSSFRETAGLATYTEVNSTRALQDLVDVNRVSESERIYHDEDERALIESYQQARVARQMSRPGLLPRERAALDNLAFARASRDQLRALLVDLPDQLVNPVDRDGNNNALLQQAQLALICFNAGLTVACDLETGGFDTHGNHDTEHRSSLQRLTNGIEYLWDTAEAMGLAGRLHVLIASDFGRTPYYNDGNGKDHWPVGSAILMKKNAPWGDRVVGLTDEGHNVIPIDPNTLAARPGAGGVVLGPGHVHEAFRRMAGLDRHPTALRYPLNVPAVDFFGTAA